LEGHSRGAVFAAFAGMFFRKTNQRENLVVILFGCPPFGNKEAMMILKQCVDVINVVHTGDWVTISLRLLKYAPITGLKVLIGSKLNWFRLFKKIKFHKKYFDIEYKKQKIRTKVVRC